MFYLGNTSLPTVFNINLQWSGYKWCQIIQEQDKEAAERLWFPKPTMRSFIRYQGFSLSEKLLQNNKENIWLDWPYLPAAEGGWPTSAGGLSVAPTAEGSTWWATRSPATARTTAGTRTPQCPCPPGTTTPLLWWKVILHIILRVNNLNLFFSILHQCRLVILTYGLSCAPPTSASLFWFYYRHIHLTSPSPNRH